jgi:hypothetical protein
MSSVSNGAQWASGSEEPTTSTITTSTTRRSHTRRSRMTRGWLSALAIAATLSLVTASSGLTPPAAAADDYLLMSRSALLALPTSGTAWSGLKGVADGSLGSPDLCDQDNDHHLKTLAAALVYARTGSASYATKARNGVMAAIGTQDTGCGNAVLSLGRQLPAYVLAADFAGLSGASDTTFRTWLKGIRAKDIGGHGTWFSLIETHRVSANNWGTHAGAARIAASAYLGDTADLAIAARITQGFLGNRSAYAGWDFDSSAMSWSCDSGSSATPITRACSKSGINVDGAILEDISRGGSLDWPPGGSGISYQVDAVAALAIQVELLSRQGYSTAWSWSSSALKRAAQLVQRSDNDGGGGWNASRASSQAPWLLNLRYGKFLPTVNEPLGRGIGFANWLWGAGANGGGGGGGGGGGTSSAAPVTRKPLVQLSTTSSVPTNATPVVLTWGLESTSDGLKRYELQMQKNGGTWTNVKLLGTKSTSHRFNLGLTSEYGFRVRAVDNDGRVGAWKSTTSQIGWRVDDSSKWLHWHGNGWGIRTSTAYIAGKSHRTASKGASVAFGFNGSSIAWVSSLHPNYGQAQIYLDGKYVKTVDLRASTAVSRKIMFAATFKEGSHWIRVHMVGTSGRPTVYTDAFFVITTD